MRLVKVSTLYPAFQRELDEEIQGEVSTSELLARLWKKEFAWSNFFQVALRRLGVEAYEVIQGWDAFDRAWCKENSTVPVRVLHEQLKRLRPEILWFQDLSRISPQELHELRELLAPELREIWGWHAIAPSEKDWERLKSCDRVITCSIALQEIYQRQGISTELMYHAFQPSLVQDLQSEPRIPASFVGSFLPGQGFHQQRMELVLRLLKEIPEFQVFGNIPSIWNLAAKKILSRMAHLGEKFRVELPGNLTRYRGISWGDVFRSSLRRRNEGAVFGRRYYEVLARSDVSLNQHIDIAGKYAANVRLFEAAGVGSCLLTDEKENLGALFERDREVVTYRSPEECIEKMRYLLDHPLERKEIAKRGQARCWRDHSFEVRAEQLKSLIQVIAKDAK